MRLRRSRPGRLRPDHRRTRPPRRALPAGELIHIDVEEPGCIPQGGRGRVLCRAAARFAARGVTVEQVPTAARPGPAPRTPGATPAMPGASAPASPTPGGRRPTAGADASTASCWRSGPATGPPPQKPNARQRSPAGSTGTATTTPAPASAPRPAASPACRTTHREPPWRSSGDGTTAPGPSAAVSSFRPIATVDRWPPRFPMAGDPLLCFSALLSARARCRENPPCSVLRDGNGQGSGLTDGSYGSCLKAGESVRIRPLGQRITHRVGRYSTIPEAAYGYLRILM